MTATATGLFQYEADDDLIEGMILASGATPQEAQRNAETEMTKIGETLPGFSISAVLPGNPFGLGE